MLKQKTKNPTAMNNPVIQIGALKITTEQLSDIIDAAFEVGKAYAIDELSSCRPMSTADVHVVAEDKWSEFIESNGGQTLHSGHAKKDIVVRYLFNNILKNEDIDFDFD